MDAQTYNLLLQRVEFLELFYSVSRKSQDFIPYTTRLSQISANLNEFIQQRYPEINEIITILKAHELWDKTEQKDFQPESHFIEEKTLLLETNYNEMMELANKITQLESLNTNEILANRFPVQIIEFKHQLSSLWSFLSANVVPKFHAKLLAYSTSIVQNYLDLVCDYNQQVAEITCQLVEAEREKRRDAIKSS